RDFHVTGVQTCALPISIPQIEGAALNQTRNMPYRFNCYGVAVRSLEEQAVIGEQLSHKFFHVLHKLDSGLGHRAFRRGDGFMARSEERRVGTEGRCGSS